MTELELDMIKSFSPKKGIAMRYFRKILRKQKINRIFNTQNN